MPDKLSARLERLEESEQRAWAAIEAVADRQASLDNALAAVAESLVRLAEAQIKTDEHIRETDARVERLGRETDARIEKLVSAMGEFLRNGKNL
jgi:chromosome segregation ATPase